MTPTTLASDELLLQLDDVLASQPQRVWELWDWGYEYGQDYRDKHRWHRGELYGFWLAIGYEWEHAKSLFEDFKLAIQDLDVVGEVVAEKYVLDDTGTSGEVLVGEKWLMRFLGEVVYTHRIPFQE